MGENAEERTTVETIIQLLLLLCPTVSFYWLFMWNFVALFFQRFRFQFILLDATQLWLRTLALSFCLYLCAWRISMPEYNSNKDINLKSWWWAFCFTELCRKSAHKCREKRDIVKNVKHWLYDLISSWARTHSSIAEQHFVYTKKQTNKWKSKHREREREKVSLTLGAHTIYARHFAVPAVTIEWQRDNVYFIDE